jgi:microcompartment protein CcmK/EutM
MRICDVMGRVWPETPLAGLGGRALVLVRDVHSHEVLAALDLVGAGSGTRVLVATGSPAQSIAGGAPVDAVVVSIVRMDARSDDPAVPEGTGPR